MINEMRVGNGLPKIKPMHEKFFIPSAKAMFLKYGETAGKWMPEIMFAGTLGFIMVDTLRESNKLKTNLKEDEKTKVVDKPDLSEFENLTNKEEYIQPTKKL